MHCPKLISIFVRGTSILEVIMISPRKHTVKEQVLSNKAQLLATLLTYSIIPSISYNAAVVRGALSLYHDLS